MGECGDKMKLRRQGENMSEDDEKSDSEATVCRHDIMSVSICDRAENHHMLHR